MREKNFSLYKFCEFLQRKYQLHTFSIELKIKKEKAINYSSWLLRNSSLCVISLLTIKIERSDRD